jgi:hypothetical protein
MCLYKLSDNNHKIRDHSNIGLGNKTSTEVMSNSLTGTIIDNIADYFSKDLVIILFQKSHIDFYKHHPSSGSRRKEPCLKSRLRFLRIKRVSAY